jgi:hypothetical protein
MAQLLQHNQQSPDNSAINNNPKPSKHPLWATKFRTPGTELRLINGKYYLYQYTTVYDPVKKRAKKISGNLLGSITEQDGFLASAKHLLRMQCQQQNQQQLPQQNQEKQQEQQKQEKLKLGPTREFGISNYILNRFQAFALQLEKVFGNLWQHIMLLAYCRLVAQAPIKNMAHLIEQSWLQQHWQPTALDAKKVSELLKDLGQNREQAVEYMQAFLGEEAYFLADTTHIPSKSVNISLTKKGRTSRAHYDPQVHILYLYGATSQKPAFYRLHAGNVREIKAFKLTMLESGVKDGTIIGDKGFYSQANIAMLEAEKLHYIIPLKRDSTLVDYSTLQANTFKKGNNFFEHEQRFIWHEERMIASEGKEAKGEEGEEGEEGKKRKRVVMFLDEALRIKEEHDYLARMKTHPEEYNQAGYLNKKDQFGTISLITNVKGKSAQEVYVAYKSRMAIETMFDSMKNVLDADKTYMQDEDRLQGWMFINHVALQFYQEIYLELQEKGLNSKYSVKDFLMLLREIRKVKINGEWHQAEITTSVEKLLNKLQLT